MLVCCLLFVLSLSFSLSARHSILSQIQCFLSKLFFTSISRRIIDVASRMSNDEIRRRESNENASKEKRNFADTDSLFVCFFVCLSGTIIRLERDLFYPLAAARQYISFCSALSKHSRTRITARTSDRTEEKTEIRSAMLDIVFWPW